MNDIRPVAIALEMREVAKLRLCRTLTLSAGVNGRAQIDETMYCVAGDLFVFKLCVPFEFSGVEPSPLSKSLIIVRRGIKLSEGESARISPWTPCQIPYMTSYTHECASLLIFKGRLGQADGCHIERPLIRWTWDLLGDAHVRLVIPIGNEYGVCWIECASLLS